MRYRIKDYTISGQSITINEDITIEDVRLVVNETQKVVICSSMQKNNVDVQSDTISVPTSVCTLSSTDQLTIEIDKGDGLQETQERLDSIDKTLLQIPDITRLYTAYAVKNDDGENTYTIVLPVSADIEHGITIKLQ